MLVLAAAGLARLGPPRRGRRPARRRAVRARRGPGRDRRPGADRAPAADAASAVSHAATMACLQAERAAIRALGASCHAPVGVSAQLVAESLHIRGFAGLPDGSEWVLDEHAAPAAGDARGRPAASSPAGCSSRARATCCAARRRSAHERRRSARARGGARARHRVPRRRGARRPRAADRARGRADRAGRRDPPRPADPGRGARARPPGRRARLRRQGGRGRAGPQEDTHAFLLEHARAGRRVVRLKGGDPFVFGRGGEEALLLREAGIPFEVVPGITAGVAAPAYAGIPVTQRELASGVAFVTGHEDPSKPESQLDWPALAAFPGTLVFYMGVRALPRIAEQLIEGGRARRARRGRRARHLPGQRTLLPRSPTWPSAPPRGGSRRPAITLVGPVAALREQIAWLESRPCTAAPIAVTRARAQASALAERLRDLGAAVVEAPAIRIEPLPGRPARPEPLRPRRGHLPERRRAAAGAAARRARSPGSPSRRSAPDRARAARARRRARRRARARGRRGPGRGPADVPVTRALIARAAEGRDVTPDALRERGAEVDLGALRDRRGAARRGHPRAAAAADPHVHLGLVRAVLRAGGGELAAADRLDRPGDERRAARARRGAASRPTPHADGLVEALLRDAERR